MTGVIVPIRSGIAIPARAFPHLDEHREPVGTPVPGLHPLRRLAAHGLNALLSRGLISTGPAKCEEGRVATRIDGKPSMVMWREIGGGELRLSVWWDLNMARHPQARGVGRCRESFSAPTPLASRIRFPEFVGATVSCWVERRTGLWIQGKGSAYLFGRYVRRETRDALEAIPDPVPLGFKLSGKFYA